MENAALPLASRAAQCAGSIRGAGRGCQLVARAGVYRGRWAASPRWPCELCGDPAGAAGICLACRAELPWLGSACPLCARPSAMPECCGSCRQDPPPWSRAIAPLAWSFPADALIARFKYGGALHLGAMLGRLLADHCRGWRPDALLPVPLHRARLAERGFNQAAELARPVARTLGVPVLADACTRVLPTAPQAGLSAPARLENLAGAFAATAAVADRVVAVVDDVLTTGSTARAVARALVDAGALRVEIWAVARGGTAQSAVKV
jgi:ComF family protein